jgi:hypothetical protein
LLQGLVHFIPQMKASKVEELIQKLVAKYERLN